MTTLKTVWLAIALAGSIGSAGLAWAQDQPTAAAPALLPEVPKVKNGALPAAPSAPPAGVAGKLPAAPLPGATGTASGAVEIKVQNASAAPLDLFVDPPAGGDPVFVMTLDPDYQAIQPSPPGRRWRLSQNNAWIGAFVASAKPKQVLRFTGKP